MVPYREHDWGADPRYPTEGTLAPISEVPPMGILPNVDNSDRLRATHPVRTPPMPSIRELVRPFLYDLQPLAISPLPVCRGAPIPSARPRLLELD